MTPRIEDKVRSPGWVQDPCAGGAQRKGVGIFLGPQQMTGVSPQAERRDRRGIPGSRGQPGRGNSPHRDGQMCKWPTCSGAFLQGCAGK